jgi:hypothetical protein
MKNETDGASKKVETTDVASSSSNGVLTNETTDVEMNVDEDNFESLDMGNNGSAKKTEIDKIKRRIPPPSTSVLDHMEIFNDGYAYLLFRCSIIIYVSFIICMLSLLCLWLVCISV